MCQNTTANGKVNNNNSDVSTQYQQNEHKKASASQRANILIESVLRAMVNYERGKAAGQRARQMG